MRLLKKILAAIVGIALALVLAFTLLPWDKWFEGQLRLALKERGFETLDFKMGSLGLHGITLNQISLGPQSPFTLDSLTLGYAIGDLLSGQVRGLHTGAFVLKQKGMDLQIGGLDIDMLPQREGAFMRGTWSMHDIVIKGLPIAVPVLAGKGTLEWQTDKSELKLAGTVQNADGLYKSDFALDYPANNTNNAQATITSAQLPWNEGMLHIKPLTVPLYSAKPVQIVMGLDRVSLNALMQQATGNHATATGAVSGEIPITIERSGVFTIGQATLKTSDQGVISLPPDVIPGDHTQVEMVRQILKNFHYTDFSIALRSDNPKKLSMLLSLKGNNPDVYNGRMVDLNVTLNGDLLDLLQQGMITIVDPKQLLTRDKNAKH